MLEWLSSKMAVAVAALLLLSSATAYFANQRDSIHGLELENVARGIAGFIDAVLDLPGETEFVAGCDGDVGLLMPKEIGGSPYEINLRRDSVIAVQKGESTVARWTGDLHFWIVFSTVFDSGEIEGLDAEHPSLGLTSCQRFDIAIEEILIDDSPNLLVFAHAPY